MRDRNKAVFGIYAEAPQVEFAVNELLRAGFSSEDVSVLMPDRQSSPALGLQKESKAPEGTTTGATAGGIVGGALGVLVGIGALAIPGLGPFIAAGPLVAGLAGLGAGGAVGGVIGALVGLGIPEFEAKRYEGRLKDGGVLVCVHCETAGEVLRAREILAGSGATEISATGEARGSDRVEAERAAPGRAEPARAEPARAAPARAEPPRAEPARATSNERTRIRSQDIRSPDVRQSGTLGSAATTLPNERTEARTYTGNERLARTAQPSRTADAKEVIATLNELIETSRDGEKGFALAAKDAKDPALTGVFVEGERSCHIAADELQDMVLQMGGSPDRSGSVKGAVHRGWVSMKAAASPRDAKAVLEECERGEDYAETKYAEALKHDLPDDVLRIVERQYRGVVAHHDRIRELRNQYLNG
jgi:uncharacterized protein (TIGR02284 family)